MKKLIVLAFIVSLILGCSSESEVHKVFSKESSETNSAVTSESFGLDDEDENLIFEFQEENKAEASNLEKGSKIIKEGNMRIEVEDLTIAKSFIDSLVSKNNGYYEKEILRNSEYDQNYNLKIRLPSDNFNLLVNALEQGGGMILEKFINAKDVTEEYLDLRIRLENNTAYLKRYKELLNKAKSIKDIIEIQEKIRNIELLIDSSKGRMKFLNNKVDFSTLSIDLITKPKEYVAQVSPPFFEDVLEAFKNGFSGLLYFILFLTNIWPLLICVLLIWLLRKKMIFTFRKKKTS